jgi:ribonuclease Z
MRRAALAGLVLLGLIGGVLWLNQDRIASAVYLRMVTHAMRPDPLADVPDGLSVGICGAGSPLPDPTRAGPCTFVIAGRQVFEVDSGQGSAKVMQLMGVSPARVDALFLTHYHSDHIADLGELMLQHWAGGASSRPLAIYGPQGLDQVVQGFEAAYQLDRGYRIAHHGPKVVPPSGFGAVTHVFNMAPDGPDQVLIDQPDLKVIAFPVDHRPVEPAVGYLFIYKDRRVVISGDTAPSPRLQAEAQGADILVHEALSPALVGLQRRAALAEGRWNVAQISHDILSYHTSPEAAARIAAAAHVRMLVLTHIVPPIPNPIFNHVFLGDAPKVYSGPIRIARDGDLIELPAGTRQIRVSRRLATY